jgi:hypothetical protein
MNNVLLNVVQFPILIYLVFVFHLSYIVFLPIMVVNYTFMHVKIHTIPSFDNMIHLKLLMLHCHSSSRFCRVRVAVVFASQGCQYLLKG